MFWKSAFVYQCTCMQRRISSFGETSWSEPYRRNETRNNSEFLGLTEKDELEKSQIPSFIEEGGWVQKYVEFRDLLSR